jgi:hypothetical protein
LARKHYYLALPNLKYINNNMFDYNTGRDPMKLRQFGRNVQNLARYISTLETKEERTKYAEALVELMKQIVPSAKNNQESNQFLWDDLHVLADFGLDVDGPFPVPEEETLDRKPDKVEYLKSNLKFRHYGRNVVLLIEEAIKLEDEEQKEAAVFHIARLLKSFHTTWNKETPEDVLIAKNIEILSEGELKLNLEKAQELDLLEPLYKDKPKPNKPTNKSGGKGGGKSQKHRRRK